MAALSALLAGLSLSTIYWIVSIAGAFVSLLAGLFRLTHIDKKRQMRCPSRHEYGTRTGEALADHLAALPTRDAPLMSGKPEEKVAKLSDVAHLMKSGDFLWFAGRAFHSYIIRIATFSEFSHGAVLEKEQSRKNATIRGRADGSLEIESLKIVQVVEGRGGEIISLAEQVAKYPGQWYWGAVDRVRFKEYDGNAAVAEAKKFVNKPYGNWAILFQVVLHCPFVVAIAYWWRDKTDELFETRPPFCSGAQQLGSKAGGATLVQGRAAQLCTPQDTAQSKLCPIKVALFPG